MTPDPSRQTGRTTHQMERASKGAVFVWCNDTLDYPKTLARKIGRTDLEIIPARRLTCDYVSHRCIIGRREPVSIVVDHHAEGQLPVEGWRALRLYELETERRMACCSPPPVVG